MVPAASSPSIERWIRGSPVSGSALRMSPRKWTSPQLLSTSAAASVRSRPLLFERSHQLRIRPVGLSALPRQVEAVSEGPLRVGGRPAVDRRAVERPQGLAGIPDHGVAIVGEKAELALARRGTRPSERDTGVRPEARRGAPAIRVSASARFTPPRSRRLASEQAARRAGARGRWTSRDLFRLRRARAWPVPIARRSGTGGRCSSRALRASESSPGNCPSATTSPCSSRSLTTNFRPGGAAALRRNSEELVGSRSHRASSTRASSRCFRASRACQTMAAVPATRAVAASDPAATPSRCAGARTWPCDSRSCRAGRRSARGRGSAGRRRRARRPRRSARPGPSSAPSRRWCRDRRAAGGAGLRGSRSASTASASVAASDEPLRVPCPRSPSSSAGDGAPRPAGAGRRAAGREACPARRRRSRS